MALVEMAHLGVFLPSGGKKELKGQPYTNVSDLVDKILTATGETYKRTHAHNVLGPIYRHFHPETDTTS